MTTVPLSLTFLCKVLKNISENSYNSVKPSGKSQPSIYEISRKNVYPHHAWKIISEYLKCLHTNNRSI